MSERSAPLLIGDQGDGSGIRTNPVSDDIQKNFRLGSHQLRKSSVVKILPLGAKGLEKRVPVVEPHIGLDVFWPSEPDAKRFENFLKRLVVQRFGVDDDPVEIEDHRVRSG